MTSCVEQLALATPVCWTDSNPQEHASRSRFKEEYFLVGSFGSSRVQVFRCRWRYKSYQWLYDDSQRRTDCKLVQDDKKHYYWLCFSNNREGGITRLWHMLLGHMSERGIQVLHKKGALSNIANLILVNFASWVDNVK